jgi:hypothetical protein
VAKWRSIAGRLFLIALGLAMVWSAWGTWEEFSQLESGQLASMKVWAPLAWIYKLGGSWSVIAKWAAIAFLALMGVGIAVYGVAPFPLPTEQQAPDAQLNFDARYNLSVSQSQIAGEETVVIQTPNGPFSVKLRKTLRDQDRLRFPGEGFERKGDLYVILHVRGG